MKPMPVPLGKADHDDLSPYDVDRIKAAIHDLGPFAYVSFADAARIYLKGKRAARELNAGPDADPS